MTQWAYCFFDKWTDIHSPFIWITGKHRQRTFAFLSHLQAIQEEPPRNHNRDFFRGLGSLSLPMSTTRRSPSGSSPVPHALSKSLVSGTNSRQPPCLTSNLPHPTDRHPCQFYTLLRHFTSPSLRPFPCTDSRPEIAERGQFCQPGAGFPRVSCGTCLAELPIELARFGHFL